MARKKKSLPSHGVQRLGEAAIAAWQQHSLTPIADLLRALGINDIRENEGASSLACTGLTGVTVGFLRTADPVAHATSLGMAVAGPYWPFVYPGLLDYVNARWREERRK